MTVEIYTRKIHFIQNIILLNFPCYILKYMITILIYVYASKRQNKMFCGNVLFNVMTC